MAHSDRPDETGLDGITATAPEAEGPSAGIFGANPEQLEILDLDDFLSNAKAVIRTAHLCQDGTLEDAFRQTIEELAELVDEEGEPLEGAEASLSDKSRIHELEAQARAQHRAIRKASRAVVFEALPVDEYQVLEDQYINNQKTRDVERMSKELISRCAIQPKLSIADVARLRKKLNKYQWLELGNNAYWVNTAGGTTIPKLPSYLPTPEQETSSSS